jgi:RNA polymerase sigma-70 factor, ECF subfamily
VWSSLKEIRRVNTTSPTLLEKLRGPNETVAWERFVKLYSPLLFAWAKRLGLQSADAADLVQDVLVKLMRDLPKFQYDAEKKNFRGWLRTICFNRWRDRQKIRATRNQPGADGISGIEAADDGLTQFWDQEHNRFVIRQAVQLLRSLKEFQPQTLQACEEVIVNQRPVAEVAAELGMSENAIYLAKLRVLRRLKEELQEFLE